MTFEIDKEGTEEIVAKIKKLDDKAIIKENEIGYLEIITTLRGFLNRYEDKHYIHIYKDNKSVDIPIEYVETIWGL